MQFAFIRIWLVYCVCPEAQLSGDLPDAELRIVDEECSLVDYYFLLDGSLPVELPDTWAEAREAFFRICVGEGIGNLSSCRGHYDRIFVSRPVGSTSFLPDGKFCVQIAGLYLRYGPGPPR